LEKINIHKKYFHIFLEVTYSQTERKEVEHLFWEKKKLSGGIYKDVAIIVHCSYKRRLDK
jgi:hypothetical protein